MLRAGLPAALAWTLLLGAAPGANALEQRVVAADGTAGAAFGQSVAIQGGTAVVGAPSAAGGGAAYVFTRSGDAWSQTGKLVPSDLAAGDEFGQSVAIDGSTIVVGAPSDDATVSNQGSAYVFSATGDAQRSQIAKLIATDPGNTDNLGRSVAIDGSTIIAGSPNHAVGMTAGAGTIYTFAATGDSTRNETARLTASDGAASDALGTSVSMDGSTIVAGAFGDDVGANADQGSAYVFSLGGGQIAHLVASDGAAGDRMGSAVSVGGGTIVAGSIYHGSQKGIVYTFPATAAGSSPESAKLTASDGSTSDFLGGSVATDGQTILAGAPLDDFVADTNSNQGSVYRFDAAGAVARNETAKLVSAQDAAGDRAGSAVAVDGATSIVGSNATKVGANASQGSATIRFDPLPPPVTPPVTPPVSPPGDTTAPKVTVTAGKGRLGKPIRIGATCDEDCSLEARGTLKVKGVKKPKLASAIARGGAGKTVTLTLEPSAKTAKALRKSDASKGKAKVTVTAKDAAGNSTTRMIPVKLA